MKVHTIQVIPFEYTGPQDCTVPMRLHWENGRTRRTAWLPVSAIQKPPSPPTSGAAEFGLKRRASVARPPSPVYAEKKSELTERSI